MGNMIGDEAMRAPSVGLGEGLGVNASLTTLWLEHNKLTEVGKAAVKSEGQTEMLDYWTCDFNFRPIASFLTFLSMTMNLSKSDPPSGSPAFESDLH